MSNVNFSPLVSIIIPVYNGSNYMKEAIDGVLCQTYKNIEVIIVNDGSNDEGNTRKIAQSYGDKIRYFEKENGGVASALNFGINKMAGDYFSWLSHDDVYYPDKIQNQIEVLKNLEDKNTVLYGNWEYIDEKSKHINYIRIEQNEHSVQKLNIPLYPIFNMLLHGCTLLIPKICFKKTGLFDEKLVTTQDYDLWFKILKEFNIRFIPQILIKSRIHTGQGSHKNLVHQKECNELFIKFLNSISIKEILTIEESVFSFFTITGNFLKNNCGHLEASEYAFQLSGTLSSSNNQIENFNLDKKNILFVSNFLKHGIGTYIKTLTSYLDDYNIYVLYSNSYTMSLYFISNRNLVKITQFTFSSRLYWNNIYSSKEYSDILENILVMFNINLLHINTFHFHSFDIIKLSKQYNIPTIYVVHDFHLICPTQHFLTGNDEFCGICDFEKERNGCLENNKYCTFLCNANSNLLYQFRKFVSENVLPGIDLYISPSESAKSVLIKFYTKLKNKKWEVIEHGLNSSKVKKNEYKLNSNKKIKIACIGNIYPHKGFNIIRDLVKKIDLSMFEFTIFGEIPESLPEIKNIIKYKHKDIINILAESEIDIVLILPIIPETFSYTLSEVLLANIPVIFTDIGALKERGEKNNIGWGIEYNDDIIVNLIDLLKKINFNRNLLLEKRESISKLRLKSLDEMSKEYSLIYQKLIKNKQVHYMKKENIINKNNFNLKDIFIKKIKNYPAIYNLLINAYINFKK